MKGFLLKQKTLEIVELNVNDTLDTISSMLDCDYIEIIYRFINGKLTRIIVDEEGKLKKHQIITGISTDGSETLVGNIFIVSTDKNIKKIIKKYGLLVYDL